MEIKTEIRTQPDSFPCADLYISAYLVSHDCLLAGHIRRGRKLIFLFHPASTAKALAREYLNGGSVNAARFTKAIQDLKALCFQNEEHEQNQ